MLAYVLNYDFGYTWPWTHGHLVAAVGFAVLAWLCGRWRVACAVMSALAVWALAGFLIVQLVFGFNSPMAMPTENFLQAGTGQVLDIGAGSGRTSVMIGLARPRVTIAALDNFSADYITDHGPAHLMANLKAAGIDKRVRVVRADMRQIPEPDETFDGVVSTYAIDHINTAGIRQTLGEVRRVLKPEGEFLMAVINTDNWLRFVYGPLIMHGGSRTAGRWRQLLSEAGLTVVEEGSTPGSLHFVGRREMRR